MATAWAPAQEFDEYRLIRALGRGTMGAVFLAEDLVLHRRVAVKFVVHHQDPAARERFLHEARAQARLQHPNVVSVFRVGELDGRPFIVSEFIPGIGLDGVQLPVPRRQLVHIGRGLARGLAAAHRAGVLHRDIKPANAILRDTGEAVLVDFGLAKLSLLGLQAEAWQPPGPTGDAGASSPVPVSRPERDDTLPLDATLPVDVERAPGTSTASAADATPFSRSIQAVPATLTRVGAFVGTPYYMAPELWLGVPASERSDIYSLGVLLYELCAGQPPHAARDVSEVRHLALERDATPLADVVSDVDPRLAEIIHRCLAREPAARFGAAAELADALDALASEPDLPEMDRALRQALLARAPQPIAEAIAALDGSRNVHQARLAVRTVARTTARYLGLVALACRSRTGHGAGSDSDRVGSSLRLLQGDGLSEAQWLELARELGRPFADKRTAHPIPELVDLFAGDAAGWLDTAMATLAEEPGASQSASEERDLLARRLPLLEELFRRLTFLSDYRLVVARGAGGEDWMGTRREPRRFVPSARPMAEGRPSIIDREGAPVVSLWPLVQVARPAPGSAPEMFLLARNGRHGARLVALPHAFEHDDDALWDWVRDNFLSSLGEDQREHAAGRAPYLGLAPFTADDSRFFFGREREEEAFRNRLRVQPVLVVVGPSGAGKSSFVAAGVVPELEADWCVVWLRPGPAPVAALEARLAAAGDATRTLLVVDQLEELFTLCRDPGERLRFAEALVAPLRAGTANRRVILSLRDDFLFRAEKLAPLRDALTQGAWLLGAPAPADLRRALVEPARRAGYEFEDPELPDEMVSEVADKPAALALLSFTASKLWDLRDRHFKRLTREAYQALGGVGGALARHAEETLAAMSADESRLLRESFRHLVTAEGTRAAMTRAELLDVLGQGDRARTVIERMIAARLLVAREAEHGAESIEVIHEALLREWPRLVQWRREDAEGARLRDQLRAAAQQWEQRGRSSGLLWRGDALVEYRLWRSRFPGALTASEREFAAASIAEAARGQRLRRVLSAGAFVILAVGIVALIQLNRRAQQSAQVSEQRLVTLYKEQARRAALADDPERTLIYLREARQRGAAGADIDFLLARAVRASRAEVLSLPDHDGPVDAVEFSRDGAWLLSASQDRTARMVRVADGALVHTFHHAGKVDTAHFDAGGDRVLTTSGEMAVLWDARSGARLHELRHPAPVHKAVFDHQGHRLASAGADGVIRLWDAHSGALVRSLEGHRAPVLDVDFSPDGSALVSTGVDRTVRLWRLRGERAPEILTDGVGTIWWYSRFSGDGKAIVGADQGTLARIWDAATGELRHQLPHPGRMVLIAMDPGGAFVLTSCEDGAARQWEIATGRLVQTMHVPSGWATSVAFSRDGARVVAGSTPGRLRMWQAGSGHLLATFKGHRDSVLWADFSPDGTHVATASEDGTVKLWNTAATDLVRTWQAHDYPVRAVALAPDGRRFATVSGRPEIRLWDVESGGVAGTLEGSDNSPFLRFSPDGARLLAAKGDELHVWAVGRSALERVLPAGSPSVAAAFDRSGAIVAVSDSGLVQAWQAGAEPILRRELKTPVSTAAFDHTGELLVTASDGGVAEIWRPATGTRLHRLGGHGGALYAIAFSPDDQRVATASWDRTVRIWSVASGALLATLEGHDAGVSAVSFGPDGRYVVTGSFDSKVGVWDAASGELLGLLTGHGRTVFAVAVTPDGRRAVSGADDGSVATWKVSAGPVARDLLDWLHACRVADGMEAGRIVKRPPERSPSCRRFAPIGGP